jgi:hypothetical protein
VVTIVATGGFKGLITVTALKEKNYLCDSLVAASPCPYEASLLIYEARADRWATIQQFLRG